MLTRMSATSLALSNLRAIVILIVLGFHSIMGYLGSLPSEPHRLDAPPYDWQIFPIIEAGRIGARGQRNVTDVNVAEVVIDLAEPGPLAVGMKVDVYFSRDGAK
jgi:hypothetical protein